MDMNIIKNTKNTMFEGCNFVVQLPPDRINGTATVLQLTDIQFIDASQRRTPDRIRPDEIEAWLPENFDGQCCNHIRSLVAQTRPDLIIITGDIVYGSFDDSGRMLDRFCTFMDSLEIPWAPVFGNHDNECRLGVARQCDRLEQSAFCLFERGSVSGHGNYTVGIAAGERLIRVLHMMDSHGCHGAEDPAVVKAPGLHPDQLELIRHNTAQIQAAQQRKIPAFLAFHIPVDCFLAAEEAKGYGHGLYTIGVDVPAKDGDFGFCLERYMPFGTDGHFIEFLHAQQIDGVFVGHIHKNCTSITYENIRWTFGLKTGQYDYHQPYQIGGTMITLWGSSFRVNHVPSLVNGAPMPACAPMFKGLFADGSRTE